MGAGPPCRTYLAAYPNQSNITVDVPLPPSRKACASTLVLFAFPCHLPPFPTDAAFSPCTRLAFSQEGSLKSVRTTTRRGQCYERQAPDTPFLLAPPTRRVTGPIVTILVTAPIATLPASAASPRFPPEASFLPGATVDTPFPLTRFLLLVSARDSSFTPFVRHTPTDLFSGPQECLLVVGKYRATCRDGSFD
jgi:hypothetical protein